MNIRFDALSIDNSAIYIIIDQLSPFLKYDPDFEYRVLDDASGSEKHRILYEQVFLPYSAESRDHFYCHHYDAPSDSWRGEQACLSMIHAINQKATWLLYYYAIKEAVEKHSKISEERIKQIAHKTTGHIIDGNRSIRDAVHESISLENNIEMHIENMIVDELTQKVREYEKAPSHPMIYR